MGDHRVGATGVMSHGDGVVDRQPGVGGLQRGSRMSLPVHRGGWMKREVEVVRDVDEDTDGDADAMCGAGVDTGVTRGMAIVSEVPAIEER
jgi:hypothetical protein